MKRTRFIAVAAVAVASLCYAVETSAGTSTCTTALTRANLIPCALEASLAAKAERQGLEAVKGRQEATSPVLPSNPVLALSAARREAAGQGPVLNWYATLSQEIEIAGQRGARRRAADAEREAQEKAVAVTDREVAAAAWRAYFEAIAAREEVRLFSLVESLTTRVATATRAAADKGLVSGIDADVAEVAYARVAQERIGAARRAEQAKTALLGAMGLDPRREVAIEGELVPLAGVEAFAAKQDPRAVEERPEVQALEASGRAHEARASMYRRARVPNPTLSVFAQNDGFNERVFGVGLSMPIPLPQPVGRTYAGEIAESEALSRRSRTEAEQARRALRLDLANALSAYASLRAQNDLYTAERLGRAEQSLRAIASEIEAGRLGPKDAVVSQQALVDLLRAGFETRKNLALGSVDLALASGYPLERGTP
ncbi:TolC family protein [Polyangium mundeleinium]|uniref:TolC family protein n=1 Tax=Polyangium mundeleinium TaxID=2995306 RepID=A0ABT5F084_9BACT|nr:TolC family protein [Polyangium mundeleinium]MDC0746577.1 TolC family protein [Polyangium mundeleinium]